MPTAFKVHPADNVATLLEDAAPGWIRIVGSAIEPPLQATEALLAGHKLALTDIRSGEQIIKFGGPIGVASQPIVAGQWVHLHNCRSMVDQRSGTLDLHTGAATDTRYE